MNKSTRMFVFGVAVGVAAHYAYVNYMDKPVLKTG